MSPVTRCHADQLWPPQPMLLLKSVPQAAAMSCIYAARLLLHVQHNFPVISGSGQLYSFFTVFPPDEVACDYLCVNI